MQNTTLVSIATALLALVLAGCGEKPKAVVDESFQEKAQNACRMVPTKDDPDATDVFKGDKILDCGGQLVVIKEVLPPLEKKKNQEPPKPGKSDEEQTGNDDGNDGEDVKDVDKPEGGDKPDDTEGGDRPEDIKDGEALVITARGTCRGLITAKVIDQQKLQSVAFYAHFNRFSNGLVFSNLGVTVVKEGEITGQTVEFPRVDKHVPDAVLATDIINRAAFQLHLIHPADPNHTILQLLDSKNNPLGMASCTSQQPAL